MAKSKWTRVRGSCMTVGQRASIQTHAQTHAHILPKKAMLTAGIPESSRSLVIFITAQTISKKTRRHEKQNLKINTRSYVVVVKNTWVHWAKRRLLSLPLNTGVPGQCLLFGGYRLPLRMDSS